MGISKLWTDLRQAGLVSEMNGREHEVEIAREVDGLSIAVDVSIWMFQVDLGALLISPASLDILKPFLDGLPAPSLACKYAMLASQKCSMPVLISLA